ncbi:hypothetical protein PVK06_018505 [Gossypium arboreum]|uniref:Uncharacterized protein n=1 Tax=Gossypium arboreum TaxID=29729 RepID=A0ABR0PH51_GOSAR|nr:hypothetical protein PVK06_018505 [Gossypium arboreum]
MLNPDSDREKLKACFIGSNLFIFVMITGIITKGEAFLSSQSGSQPPVGYGVWGPQLND